MPTEVIVQERRRKYRWPEAQLNVWLLIMLTTACFLTGAFGQFMSIQSTMHLGVPWILPYMVTTGAISITFFLIMLWLINARMLLPGVVLVGTFILFVLWLAGLVGVAQQLFGGSTPINQICTHAITTPTNAGPNIQTLAFLEQRSICQLWQAGFSFLIIGLVFFIWMFVMAFQTNNDQYD